MSDIPCRLCQGRSRRLFTLEYLCRLEVQVYRCDQCESLETEEPYWLNISYDEKVLTFGNDIAMRCMNLQAWVTYVAMLFGMRPSQTRILDYGSGPALLVRMLRDLGFDALAYDPHTDPTLARGFLGDVTTKFDMLVCVETWEHFVNPAEELDRIFAPRHDLVVVRTQPYRGEGKDWYYFFPEGGQHVFFYSHKAREYIARKYGYGVRSYGDMSIFSRQPMSHFQCFMLDHHRYPWMAVRSLLPLAPHPGVARDDVIVTERFRKVMSESPWSDRVRALEAGQRTTPHSRDV